MKTNNITAALALLKNAQADLINEISEIRAEENRHSGEIANLKQMPIPFEDFSIYLREHVLFLGQEWFSSRRPMNLTVGRMGDIPMNKHSWSSYEEDGEMVGLKHFMPDFCVLQGGSDFGAMCFVMPELVHEKLMAGYRETIGVRWGSKDLPSVEQRRASVAQLGAALEVCQARRAALEAELSTLTGVTEAGKVKAGTADMGPLSGQRLINPDLISER